jgi:tyrosine-protein kinase Etk/Wzc
VFAVSSARPLARKGDLAAALAIGFAALGKRVLLVDFDHRARLLTDAWNKSNLGGDLAASKPGLEDVLAGAAVEAGCRPTAHDKVYFLPQEEQEKGHIGSLTSRRVHEFLARAAAEFDVVLLDTPPILEGLDAALICKEAESLLLTATPASRDRDVTQAISRLETAGVVVGGVLFCDASVSTGKAIDKGMAAEIAAFRPAENGSYLAALFGASGNIGRSKADIV